MNGNGTNENPSNTIQQQGVAGGLASALQQARNGGPSGQAMPAQPLQSQQPLPVMAQRNYAPGAGQAQQQPQPPQQNAIPPNPVIGRNFMRTV